MKKRKKEEEVKKKIKLKKVKENNIEIKKERVKKFNPAKYYEVKHIKKLDDRKFKIDLLEYRLVYNYRNAFSAEKLAGRFSDVLMRYDYVVGDLGYDQLRLRGFFRSNNTKVFTDQKINTLVDYLYEFCNFGCAFFVLERLESDSHFYDDSTNKKKYNSKKRHHYKKGKTKHQNFVEEDSKEWIDKKHKVVIKTRREKIKKFY
ncbi:MAG: YutD family protein [Streptococcaceae bacterium]|nr:YutD family protein [Streptococcaceae bacterium]